MESQPQNPKNSNNSKNFHTLYISVIREGGWALLLNIELHCSAKKFYRRGQISHVLKRLLDSANKTRDK